MNPTLIPIAALLFLLTGFAAPADIAGPRGTTVALMRRYFGRDGVGCVQASFAGVLRVASGFPGSPRPLRRTHGAKGQIPAAAVVRGADRKRYKTRFGFAEGTYLAIGPPQARFRAVLG